MDRNQEVLALINNAKTQLTGMTEKQREINHNIENTLNMANQNRAQVICKGEHQQQFVIELDRRLRSASFGMATLLASCYSVRNSYRLD